MLCSLTAFYGGKNNRRKKPFYLKHHMFRIMAWVILTAYHLFLFSFSLLILVAFKNAPEDSDSTILSLLCLMVIPSLFWVLLVTWKNPARFASSRYSVVWHYLFFLLMLRSLLLHFWYIPHCQESGLLLLLLGLGVTDIITCIFLWRNRMYPVSGK